jgi:hypothetical protein
MRTKTTEPQPAICLHCGAVEEMHHAFEAYVREPGCVCAQSVWHLANEICTNYAEQPGTKWCTYCEHDKACHREGK